MQGFPIRTSVDLSLVDDSPQLFAVTHVLHRFLAPRHPPLALYNFEIKEQYARTCSAVLKGHPTARHMTCLQAAGEQRVATVAGRGTMLEAEVIGLRRLPQNGREDKETA